MFPAKAIILLLAVGLLQACGDAGNSSTNDAGTAAIESAAQPAATPAPAQAQLTVTDVKPASDGAATSTYQDLHGKPLELSAYAGKKVFLNYWATWCAPCIREIPSITRA